jgi:hypothetical protein
MKTGPDALCTAENELGSAKREKRDPTPTVSPKTRPGAENMKTRFEALGTAENESGVQNMKNGPDAHGTAGNEYGIAKHEIGTRRARYHRKRVRKGKT